MQRLGAAQAGRNPPAQSAQKPLRARLQVHDTNAPCSSLAQTASLPWGGEEKVLLRLLTRFPPLQLQHLQIGTCEELQCCRSIERLLCLCYPQLQPSSARLQLQKIACNCRTPRCNCRGSAAIRVCKCTLQTPRPTREMYCSHLLDARWGLNCRWL